MPKTYELNIFDFDGTLTDNTHRKGLPVEEYLSWETLKKDPLRRTTQMAFSRSCESVQSGTYIITAREELEPVKRFLKLHELPIDLCGLYGRPNDLVSEENFDRDKVRRWKGQKLIQLAKRMYAFYGANINLQVTIWEDDGKQLEVYEEMFYSYFDRDHYLRLNLVAGDHIRTRTLQETIPS